MVSANILNGDGTPLARRSVLAVGLATRLMPTLERDARGLVEALRGRGVESTGGGIETRIEDASFGVVFENNGSVNFSVNQTFDRLAADTRILSATIPAGSTSGIGFGIAEGVIGYVSPVTGIVEGRPDEGVVSRGQIVQRGDVPARDDEHVQRRLRVDVLERDQLLERTCGHRCRRRIQVRIQVALEFGDQHDVFRRADSA